MSEHISLQKVGPKDMRVVVDLLAQFVKIPDVKLIKRIEARVQSDSHLLLLAKIEKTPVGLIECIVSEPSTLTGQGLQGRIGFLAVSEPYRRRGIASQLLETAGFWFSTQHAPLLFCDAPREAPALREFLAARGFAEQASIMTRRGK